MHDLNESEEEMALWAPFQLVLVWAWEMFLKLQPERNLVGVGEPRLAQWHEVKKLQYGNLQAALDSAGEHFSWRPYATKMDNTCVLSKLCREKADWVSVNPDLDEELESFARCLRPSELVGVEYGHCIEQYLPHRVARQFGMDQDLPGNVVRFNVNNTIAWKSYNKPISFGKLYIPSRFFSPEVTLRYFEWCNQSKLGGQDEVKSVGRQRKEREDSDICCPLGFSPKCDDVEDRDSDQQDKLALKEMFKSQEIDEKANREVLRDGSPLLGIEEMGHIKEPVEETMQKQVATGVKTAMEDENKSEEELKENGGESQLSSEFNLNRVKALDARVAKLEKLIAEMKAARANRLLGNQKIKAIKEEHPYDPW